jgi:hypothetical protein
MSLRRWLAAKVRTWSVSRYSAARWERDVSVGWVSLEAAEEEVDA